MTKQETNEDSGRLPPYSAEAEQSLLGSVMLDSASVFPEAIEKHGITRECFYDLRHQNIFAAMVTIRECNGAIDEVTVGERLRQAGNLDQVGGYAYLSSLSSTVPASSNAPYYASIVKEKHTLRKTIQLCTNAIASAYSNEDGGSLELVNTIEVELASIRNSSECDTSAPIGAEELANKAMDRAERMFTSEEQPCPTTGFQDIDRMVRMEPGCLIIIAARPSRGKTTLACNIATAAASRGFPTGIVSLEMTSDSLALRMVAAEARISMSKFRYGATHQDFTHLLAALSRFRQLPLWVSDRSGVTVAQCKSVIRKMHKDSGIKLGVIDYLQLIAPDGKRDNREQEVALAVRSLKGLAKELRIPIILLAQLNRESEKGKKGPRRPQLHDLRESGSIEQDADIVIFIHPEDNEADQSHADLLPTTIIIAKNRDGPTGDVSLNFQRSTTRFEQPEIETENQQS